MQSICFSHNPTALISIICVVSRLIFISNALVENFLGIDKTSYFLLLENNVNSATIQLEKQKKGLG